MNENNKNSALLEIYTKILHKGKSLILILIFVLKKQVTIQAKLFDMTLYS